MGGTQGVYFASLMVACIFSTPSRRFTSKSNIPRAGIKEYPQFHRLLDIGEKKVTAWLGVLFIFDIT